MTGRAPARAARTDNASVGRRFRCRALLRRGLAVFGDAFDNDLSLGIGPVHTLDTGSTERFIRVPPKRVCSPTALFEFREVVDSLVCCAQIVPADAAQTP